MTHQLTLENSNESKDDATARRNDCWASSVQTFSLVEQFFRHLKGQKGPIRVVLAHGHFSSANTEK